MIAEELEMPGEQISQRDFGHLEAQVAQLRQDVATLQTTVNDMAKMMQQAQGGWRMLALMSGVSGSIGAGVLWVVQHWPWR